MWVRGGGLWGEVWELLCNQPDVLLPGGSNIPGWLRGCDGWLMVVVVGGGGGGQLRWWDSAELAPAEGLGVGLFGLLLGLLLLGTTLCGR